jgi:lipopolysaccharide export system permease protein
VKILRRYFLKEFFKYFFIVLLTLTAISVVAEFFDKVPEFYSKEPPFTLVIQYLLLQSPRVILYALPFASLFSILITIGIASKWRETLIIKSSGNSTRKLFSIFLFVGLIITLVALLLGETVVPAATRKATWVRKVKILKEVPRITHREEALWLKGLDGSLIRIDGFVENENKILKTSIFSLSSLSGMEKRIEADEAEWVNGSWSLKNVTVFDLINNKTQKYKSLISDSLEEPRIFREEMKKPKEMNFIELHSYYTRLEKSGFKNLRYLVRLYEKIAYPTINFVMILFGVALSLNTRWGGGIRAAGLGVIVSVLYWLLYATSISLGNTGILKPWLAPWISPVAFGILGSILYAKIKE